MNTFKKPEECKKMIIFKKVRGINIYYNISSRRRGFLYHNNGTDQFQWNVCEGI